MLKTEEVAPNYRQAVEECCYTCRSYSEQDGDCMARFPDGRGSYTFANGVCDAYEKGEDSLWE
jgi:hypothetical protein